MRILIAVISQGVVLLNARVTTIIRGSGSVAALCANRAPHATNLMDQQRWLISSEPSDFVLHMQVLYGNRNQLFRPCLVNLPSSCIIQNQALLFLIGLNILRCRALLVISTTRSGVDTW